VLPDNLKSMYVALGDKILVFFRILRESLSYELIYSYCRIQKSLLSMLLHEIASVNKATRI